MFVNTKSPIIHRIYCADLKKKISSAQTQIHEKINAVNAKTVPRTQAVNFKRPYQTVEAEREARQDILAEQIKVWRRIVKA